MKDPYLHVILKYFLDNDVLSDLWQPPGFPEKEEAAAIMDRLVDQDILLKIQDGIKIQDGTHRYCIWKAKVPRSQLEKLLLLS